MMKRLMRRRESILGKPRGGVIDFYSNTLYCWGRGGGAFPLLAPPSGDGKFILVFGKRIN